MFWLIAAFFGQHFYYAVYNATTNESAKRKYLKRMSEIKAMEAEMAAASHPHQHQSAESTSAAATSNGHSHNGKPCTGDHHTATATTVESSSGSDNVGCITADIKAAKPEKPTASTASAAATNTKSGKQRKSAGVALASTTTTTTAKHDTGSEDSANGSGGARIAIPPTARIIHVDPKRHRNGNIYDRGSWIENLREVVFPLIHRKPGGGSGSGGGGKKSAGAAAAAAAAKRRR